MNTIICPECDKEITISDAITKQIEQHVLEEERLKHKEELEKQKQVVEQKIAETFEVKMKDTLNAAEEEKKRSEKLLRDLLKTNEEKRMLLKKDQEREIEMQKRLLGEQSKMQEEISKTEQEKSGLVIAEMKKQLDDTKKALEEAQRKAAQHSQQLQGEVLELELEELLKSSFPQDDIEPVGKGVTGADIRHIVKSPKGFSCGVILWELKSTKEWSDKWIGKLKEDLRNEKANIPVIVSIELPKEVKSGFGLKDGVWICSHALIMPLAMVLRKNLLDVGYQKAISANKGEKAELLYSYVTSHEFQQQVENILEAYKEMREQITRERIAYEKSWKQREMQAQRIILSTANIIGDMQGRVGASMPQIKGLELLDSGEEV